MVPYPTTLGDEITFLFCFLQAQKKESLGRAKKYLHLKEEIKLKLWVNDNSQLKTSLEVIF